MPNWFALTVGLLEIGAGVFSLTQGRLHWAGIWGFYGLASIFLFLAEGGS